MNPFRCRVGGIVLKTLRPAVWREAKIKNGANSMEAMFITRLQAPPVVAGFFPVTSRSGPRSGKLTID